MPSKINHLGQETHTEIKHINVRVSIIERYRGSCEKEKKALHIAQKKIKVSEKPFY